MTGRLVIVGLGPGAPELMTPLADDALAAATDLVGYAPYLARVPERPGQARHASDNREELARAGHALDLAASGKSVAVVSSGDPGVFAMASAVFEAIETGKPSWRDVEVTVVPGVSAMLAAAARVGAPLGHDFCVVSLSDNLKPWDLVLKRLEAAAAADFVIVLYNPASKARPWQLGEALARIAKHRAGATPVIFARAVSEPRREHRHHDARRAPIRRAPTCARWSSSARARPGSWRAAAGPSSTPFVTRSWSSHDGARAR